MEKRPDFKSMPPKSKIQYIWDYYRWPIIAVICVGAFAFSLIRHYATYRPPLLNVIMINSSSPFGSDASGFDEFLEAYGYENYDGAISLNASLSFYDDSASYSDRQVLTTMLAAGGQDLFFGNGELYENYAAQGAFLDLASILPEETLEKYDGHILYSTNEGETEAYPCAIELTDNKWIVENGYYSTCYFGVLAQTGSPDISADFAEFLLAQ